MKIEIFAKTGKIEVDNLNALIALVESGVVEKTTIIKAGQKQAEAQKFRELREIFDKTDTKTESMDAEAVPTPTETEKDNPGEKIEKTKNLDVFTVVAVLIVSINLIVGSKIAYSKSVKKREQRLAAISQEIEKNTSGIFVDHGGLSVMYYKMFWDYMLPQEPETVAVNLSDRFTTLQQLYGYHVGNCSGMAENIAFTFSRFSWEEKAVFLGELKKNVDAAISKGIYRDDGYGTQLEYLTGIKNKLARIGELWEQGASTPFPMLFFLGSMVIPIIASIIVILVARILKRNLKN